MAVLQERSVLLRKWFDLLTLHKDDLAKLITFECVSVIDWCLIKALIVTDGLDTMVYSAR